jgi:hypothetical protein
MTVIGYTMMCEHAVRISWCDMSSRRASGLGLRGHQRPLLPVAGLARPFSIRQHNHEAQRLVEDDGLQGGEGETPDEQRAELGQQQVPAEHAPVAAL